MIPILYSIDDLDFHDVTYMGERIEERYFKGVGTGIEGVISCVVTEERNGKYTMMMVVGAKQSQYARLEEGNVIVAKPNDTDDNQAFRIYRIVRRNDGKNTVYCEHISSLLKDCTAGELGDSPDYPMNAQGAMEHLLNVSFDHYFFSPPYSDINRTAFFDMSRPKSIMSYLMGEEGSILQLYNGEYKFDNFRISLLNNRGKETGVTLEYGKNVTSITYESDISNTYNGVVPYWIGRDDSDHEILVTLSSTVAENRIVYADNHETFPFDKLLPVDFSDKFNNKPTAEQLRAAAKSYILNNKINVPDITIKVSFVPIWQAVGNEDIADLERVSLCDIVDVYYPGVTARVKAKVVKTVYNVLTERYDSIEIGTIKNKMPVSLNKDISLVSRKIERIKVSQSRPGKITLESGDSTYFILEDEEVYEIMIRATTTTDFGIYWVSYGNAVTNVSPMSGISVSHDPTNEKITIQNNRNSSVFVIISERYSYTEDDLTEYTDYNEEEDEFIQD